MAAAVTTTSSPFRFCEPLTNISPINVGKPTTISLIKGKRLLTFILAASCTKAALGVGQFSIPLVSDCVAEMRFNPTGDINRRRKASTLFGYTGLNALNRKENGGTVVYTQVGNNALSVVPVLIGSPEDVAQQALLTANTATTATFYLPWMFAEDFRKQYAQAEMTGFPTAWADGKALTNPVMEIDVPTTANITGIAYSAWEEYDEMVAAAGATVYLAKEKYFTQQYVAAGDVELGKAINIKAGEVIQRISLQTVTDRITKLVIKQGTRIIRNYSDATLQVLLRKSGFNGYALVSNRIDIEFDPNDDPTSALVASDVDDLSIVATLATANDAGKTIEILPTVFGPAE